MYHYLDMSYVYPESVLEMYPPHPNLYTRVWCPTDAISAWNDKRIPYTTKLDEFKFKEILTSPIFMAPLYNVRAGPIENPSLPDWALVGHAYDPWLRDITSEKDVRFKAVRTRIIDLTASAFSMERLFLWTFDTTVASTKMRIMLYCLAKIAYRSQRITEDHIKSMHPYVVNDRPDYDLAELAYTIP